MSKSEGAGIGAMGELLVEFVARSRNGHHLVAGTYDGPFASGAPGIFIDQAARVGGRAIFAGAVGDDAFGTVLRDRLAAVGVAQDLIATAPGVPTGSAFVSYNDDGSRDFVFNIAHSAAARFPRGPAAIATFLQFGTNIFHISGSSLGDPQMCAAALDFCRALSAEGVAISFDPNVRKELLGDPGYLGAVTALIELATYFLPSLEDAQVLFPGESFDVYAPRLIAQGCRYVVLKRGADGCEALGPHGEHLSLSAHRVEVVDPTGAGDCFCATFVTLLGTQGFSLPQALRHANAAGALAVTRLGPMEGNSDLTQITAFLAAQG